MKSKVPLKDLDYVELYAEELKKNNSLFSQQKKLIESQLSASSLLFKNMFTENFKINAREYLKKIRLIHQTPINPQSQPSEQV